MNETQKSRFICAWENAKIGVNFLKIAFTVNFRDVFVHLFRAVFGR